MLCSEQTAVPGMGWVADKFLQERRTLDEFAAAQVKMREVYAYYRQNDYEWPGDEATMGELLTQVFGDRGRVETSISFPTR